MVVIVGGSFLVEGYEVKKRIILCPALDVVSQFVLRITNKFPAATNILSSFFRVLIAELAVLKRVPRSFHNHPEGSSLIVDSIFIWWFFMG